MVVVVVDGVYSKDIRSKKGVRVLVWDVYAYYDVVAIDGDGSQLKMKM